jgi:hypothetical protein
MTQEKKKELLLLVEIPADMSISAARGYCRTIFSKAPPEFRDVRLVKMEQLKSLGGRKR